MPEERLPQPVDSLDDDNKWRFALETYKEAMADLRHYQSTSLKVATWGITSLAVLSAWILKQDAFSTITDRVLLGLLAVAFVFTLWLIQHNCSTRNRKAHVLVIRLDKAFSCFTPGVYIRAQPLLPIEWSRLHRTPFLKRTTTSLMSPLLIGLLVTLGTIFLR